MRTSDCLATGSRRRVEVESSASGYSTRPPVDWTESCRWHDYRFAGQSKSGFMSRHESRFRRDQFGIDGKPREIAGRVRNAEISKEPDRFEIGRKNCHSVKWWRGLDSNQRTLARADLQSAAFNHSATSPGAGRGAMWRRGAAVSTRVTATAARVAASPCRAQQAGNFRTGLWEVMNLERVKGIEPSS